jgi:hypothetical protein
MTDFGSGFNHVTTQKKYHQVESYIPVITKKMNYFTLPSDNGPLLPVQRERRFI